MKTQLKVQNQKKSSLKWIALFCAAALIGITAVGAAVLDKKYPWIWMYLADQLRSKPAVSGPVHVMFVYVDHFEPHDLKTMQKWLEDYPVVANNHADADGRHPQHTSFWYNGNLGEEDKLAILRQLAELAYRGYGETELHLHHWNDNEESLTRKMNDAIRLSQWTGAMITAEAKPRTAFGFIHGRWSLDNSRGKGDCGVNNEITILRRLGCYADFTNPSWGIMHPRTVNRLYYATDDPEKPKSYDSGPQMQVGKPGVGDLLIFEGPSVVRFQGKRPVYDHGDITHEELPTAERVRRWIAAGISVKNRPEWVFVKVFTHGVVSEDHDAVLGSWADRLYTELEKNYNDGKKYVLHYVSSREAYNIAKAAEAGKSGNPYDYRDYVIAPYVQNQFLADVSFEAVSFDKNRAVVHFLVKNGSRVLVRIKGRNVIVTGGAVVMNEVQRENETLLELSTLGSGMTGFSFEPFETAPKETKPV